MFYKIILIKVTCANNVIYLYNFSSPPNIVSTICSYHNDDPFYTDFNSDTSKIASVGFVIYHLNKNILYLL